MAERTDLLLCWPGRTSAAYAKAGVAEYLRRIRRFRSCRCLILPEEPTSKRYAEAHRLEREGRKALERIDAAMPLYLVVVDPQGKMLGSLQFADFLRRQCYDDTRTLAFFVGGPAGVAPAVRARADLLLGLSKMTLPHDMARLVLAEQLYRGFTLIHGLPYDR